MKFIRIVIPCVASLGIPGILGPLIVFRHVDLVRMLVSESVLTDSL